MNDKKNSRTHVGASKAFTVAVQHTTPPQNVKIISSLEKSSNSLHSSLADQQIPLVLQVYNAALMQAACPSSGSISYSNLHTGSHTFTFKAIDAAGNSAYDRFSWTIPAATAELIEAD